MFMNDFSFKIIFLIFFSFLFHLLLPFDLYCQNILLYFGNIFHWQSLKGQSNQTTIFESKLLLLHKQIQQITKLNCPPNHKMSQLHTSETFNIQRLTQIARAQQPDQDKYLNNILINKINRETLNELKTNVCFLDSNDEKQNKLKNLISATFPTLNERLQLEQKKQQDKTRQNQKNKSDYVTKVLILVAIYFAAFYAIAKAFFKSQYTSTGEQIPISTSEILVGIGCQLIIAIIALAIYCCLTKQITNGDLNRKQKRLSVSGKQPRQQFHFNNN